MALGLLVSPAHAASDGFATRQTPAPTTAAPDEGRPAASETDPFTVAPVDDPFSVAPAAVNNRVDALQELSLEQLLTTVVTATKTAENLFESPAIVTVITGAEMRRWGYQSVEEVLRHVVGFYVIDDQLLPNVAVRGVSGGLRAESSILKVMIDGQSVAFRSTSGNWLGSALVPLSAVERIEIIRGPASSLYGADAFLGVVNVMTYAGRAVKGGHVALTTQRMGEHQGFDQDMVLGTTQGPLDVLMSTRLRYQNLNGLMLPESSPAASVPVWRREDRQARGLDQYDGVGLVKLTYAVSERTAIRFTGYASMLDHGGEFADWYQLAHGRDESGRFSENRVSLVHGVARLGATVGLTDALDLELSASYFRGGPTSRDRVEVGSEIFFVRRQFSFAGGEAETSATWRAFDDLTLVAGVGASWDQEEPLVVERVLKASPARQQNGGGAGANAGQSRADEQLVNPGVFGQAIWKPLGELLGVTAGLRYDWHNIYGNEFSGRIAVVSSPWDSLHLKLMAGNAFKAPTPLQLYAVPYAAGDVIGNPDLSAQHVSTVEGQAIYEAWNLLTLSLGTTYSLVTDKAEFTPQGVNQVAKNIAEVGSLSFEGEASARYHERVTGYLNAAYNHTVAEIGEEGYRANLLGSQNSLYPKVIVNGGTRGIVPGLPLEVGAELSYVSSRRASSDNILENVGAYSLDPYWLLSGSLAVSGEFLMSGKTTRLMLFGRNLLDAGGTDPGFGGIDYPLVGRTLFLQWSQEI